MSPFMPIIDSLVLSDRPPESNVMPLPTSATVPRAVPPGSHASFTKRGSSVDPRLTPSRPPSFSSSIALRSSTSMSNPLSSARSCARSANAVGVRVPPGWLTRSRATRTASPTARPRSSEASTRLPPLPTTVSDSMWLRSGSDLRAV